MLRRPKDTNRQDCERVGRDRARSDLSTDLSFFLHSACYDFTPKEMKVTFTKTGERRYKITVELPGRPTITMDPAAGFDERLPHDAAHFLVEDEFNIAGGVFGQLAMGGTANSFYPTDSKVERKSRKRGVKIAKANKADAQFVEHAIYAVQSRWEQQDIIPDTELSPKDIQRISSRFEEFAKVWTKIRIGRSITLEWNRNSPRCSR